MRGTWFSTLKDSPEFWLFLFPEFWNLGIFAQAGSFPNPSLAKTQTETSRDVTYKLWLNLNKMQPDLLQNFSLILIFLLLNKASDNIGVGCSAWSVYLCNLNSL